ncbi:aspartate ammonia-lyase [Hallella multisaccharivorax DSM 17128]|uniref:Aspartate ammonia-lyase n=1 Tax=Hallella multisaccharivorax DSM 17128 TaxID=688246 RepID=F8N6J7_9BACT|nr:aspartate ammonia-lyase [Hallella multisaccharivorax]EGN56212.1 Aspartate ammonia-lyase [Hallella multisaccharivorax DSM 17128]GJG29725.1 aspartate ammonia-lyase [Hallella multisaccharivorax DSM 17128]
MEEKNYRIESDLLGELKVPAAAYYGVQTQRALNNYHISRKRMRDYPDYVVAIAYVKLAAIQTNHALGVINDEISGAIEQACKELIDGKLHDQFPVDMMQGGAGTSVNMNANEVIANRALEIMGHKKGEYQYCYPNDHVNCGQSTNDVYPTTIRLAVIRLNKQLVASLTGLISSLRYKADEFKEAIKMGRTQLQDAVPMTFGQEFNAYADNLEEELLNLERNVKLLHEINMGGTAIGTGLNAVPGFAKLCAANLSRLTGENFISSPDLVEATPDTGAYVSYSSALKRLAVKLSKFCNDLRLMASGPRCGLHEINLPAMAPGSSIMPGKVNPVIPEVVNQTCFKVIGNDTTITFAAEAGQLELNVMEPVITECLFESEIWLSNALDTLTEKCVLGITVNKEHCIDMVKHSIGIVTALNPYIGYKNSTKVAKEAFDAGKSVYDVVLEKELMTKEELDNALDPKNMLQGHKFSYKDRDPEK